MISSSGGSPPRKAVATVIVSVTDENEQPPYFEETPYKAEIVENKEYSNSVVLKVTYSINFVYFW